MVTSERQKMVHIESMNDLIDSFYDTTIIDTLQISSAILFINRRNSLVQTILKLYGRLLVMTFKHKLLKKYSNSRCNHK